MRVLFEVARRGFRRFATYRGATAAGVFTNTIFGFIQASVMLAVYAQREEVGGFDRTDALTYVFVTQGLLMVVGAFAGTGELGERIKSGDIAIDLYRPLDLQAYTVALDLGRAAFHALARGVPPFAVGALVFDLALPPSPALGAAFVLSLAIATLASAAWRFLLGLWAFWLLDDRGPTQLAVTVWLFLSGFILPITFFPGWLEAVARALPFAAMVHLPVEVFLGKHTGAGLAAVLAQQVAWSVVLLLLGRLVLAAGTRKLVVQGG